MEVRNVQEQKTAAIRVRTPLARLKDELGKGDGEIMGGLGSQGMTPGGAAFAIYYNMDMNDLDVEMGFVVASTCRAAGRMKPGTLPGGRTVVAVHKGPYETMERTYNEITAFMAQQKVTPRGACYEVYITGPDVKPEDMVTEIYFPLKE